MIEFLETLVKSNARKRNKNSKAKTNPAIKQIFVFFLLKTIGFLVNFIHIMINKKAINDLKVNETLLIAGKGHEKVQIIKNAKLKFDDYEIAKNTIEK